jgi:mono/diheme cytochrome c family protein
MTQTGWRPRRLAGGAALAVLAAAALAACNPGAYPVDIFKEMHYQPSQRRLEPERLAPPDDAVPVTGGQPDYTFDEAASLVNPTGADAQSLARGREVYRVNCAACHGMDGHARTPVADRFRSAGAVAPVDFTSARVRARTDGQLYWIVTNGLGNMPPFRHLLTGDDVWLAVRVIRGFQG